MAKQLNVNLAFTADTKQAKSQIQELQKYLNELSTNPTQSGKLNITDDLQKASTAAAELKVHLNNALNEKTGTLDFTKLNQSIKKSNKSLEYYGKTLLDAGEGGRKAFSALATSISQAEVPIKRSNALLSEMATTLKNTARWQISSSILHGFMGTLQSAYGYAQDLNKSLTDIRIVSGQSAEQMAVFAEKANRAAKALGTTTTEYTDAALIYYQQGLKDQEIEQRTNVTIKMANVTGEQVEDVSSYMTAIWNNFNKEGDKSAEHYADIMTKLGAATAASTDEIAAGLSKFSAVADTIGLSFEMASSSVTAIVDQTRESPEVVGTALKTIFSRVEGLKQGETLEDGTDLNKYSQGLATVGVNIKDANGQLKDMDVILQEIGDVWETLNKDQQIALSQTVAGVRQYNQFMALFDNWGKVEENLEMAADAGGTLQEQADIYAESWEAARNRVEASLEKIYNQLLDDKAFITILDGFSLMLNGISNLITGVGGLGGVLTSLGAIAGKVFHKQIAEGLRNMAFNLKMSTQVGREAEQKSKERMMSESIDMLTGNKNFDSTSGEGYNQVLKSRLELQKEFINNQKNMSDYEKQIAQQLLDANSVLGDRLILEKQIQEEAENRLSDASDDLMQEVARKGYNKETKRIDSNQIEGLKKFKDRTKDILNFDINADDFELKFNKLLKDLDKNDLPIGPEGFDQDFSDIKQRKEAITQLLAINSQVFADAESYDRSKIDEYVKALKIETEQKEKAKKAGELFGKSVEDTKNTIKNAKGNIKDYADGVVSLADGLSGLTSAVFSIKGAFDVLNDPDMSGLEKFLTILTSITSATSMTIMSFGELINGAQSMKGWMGDLATVFDYATEEVERFGFASEKNVKIDEGKKPKIEKDNNIDIEADNSLRRENQALEENEKEKKENAKASIAASEADDKLGASADNTVESLERESQNLDKDQNDNDIDIPDTSNKSPQNVKEVGEAVEKVGEAAEEVEEIVDDIGDAGKNIDDVAEGIDVVGESSDLLQKKFKNLKTDTINLTKSFRRLLRSIAPYAVAFAAVAGITAAAYYSLNENRIAAEKANKAYEEQIAVQEALKNSNEEAKSSLSQYENAIKSLEGLTEGTLEWVEALNDANLAIMNILEKFPELAQFVTVTNGKMEISSEGIEQMTELMTQQLQNSMMATNLSMINKLENENPGLIEQRASFIFGINQETLTQINDLINQQGSSWLTDEDTIRQALGDDASDLLVKAIDENKEEIVELNTQLKSNESTIKATQEVIAASIVKDEDTYQLSTHKQALEEGYLTALESEKEKQWLNEVRNMSKGERIFEYADDIGANDSRVRFGKMQVKYGEDWQDVEDETVNDYLSNKYAELALKESEYLDQLETVLSSIKMDDDLEGTLLSLTKENFEAGKTGIEDLSLENQKELLNSIIKQRDQITPEALEILGFDNVESLIQSILDVMTEDREKKSEVNKDEALGVGKGGIALAFSEDAKQSAINQSNWENFVKNDLINFSNRDNFQIGTDINGKAQYGNMSEYLETNEVDFSSAISNIDWSTFDSSHIEEWFSGAFLNAVKKTQEQNALSEIDNEIEFHGLDSKEVSKSAEELQELAEVSDEVSDHLKDNAIEAKEISAENARMNKGLNDLNKSWKKYEESVEESGEESLESKKAFIGVKESVGDLLALTDTQALPDSFFENQENLELIKKAAEGDTEAIRDLQIAAAKEMVLGMSIDEASKQEILSVLDDFRNEDLEIGAHIDDSQAAQQLWDLLVAAGATADEIQDKFDAIGWNADITEETLTLSDTDVKNGSITVPKEINEDGTVSMQTIPLQSNMTAGATITYPVINSKGKGKGGSGLSYRGSANATAKASGAGKKGGGGGGGGGGKSSKPAEKVKFTKKQDIVKRYKEQDDILDNIKETLDDINKQEDRLYGNARLASMEKEAKALLAQKDALEAKKVAAEDYLKIDRQILDEVAQKHGLSFQIDEETKDILNYTDQMNKLYSELHAAEEQMSKMSTKEQQDEFQEATIKPIQDKIEEIKEALEQYEETKELFEDLQNQIDEAFYAWQDKNYEKLQYEIELKIEIKDDTLSRLDYFLDKYSDDVYKMYEAIDLMFKKPDTYKDIISTRQEEENKLKQLYDENAISQQQYIEGLKEVRDSVREQLSSLIELDKTMLHYQEDTLSAVSDELEDFTDNMTSLTQVLDHYVSLMDILGKSKDYEAMGNFLEGKAETLRNSLDVATEYYNTLLEETNVDELWRNYQKALASGDEDMAIWWKTQWDAQVDALNEAQEEMLGLTEEWASAMKAVIENNMTKIADILEKALSNGIGFETLLDGFDKLNTRQEEYLTNTNKIYETNKLMREANKALDQTDNSVAKQKLKNFVEETKSLQENTKLSQYELDIQKAKYDLLLAEIALQEAQNAKSTVRLSRDSEGNYGYIYTADQDAINDAQQGVDDAQNSLYNISLEGQQKYTEKYLQSQQEMFNALTKLQQDYLNGEIASEEEYQLKKEQILEHYLGENGILTTYQNLYNIAVRTDIQATEDYWGKSYGEMTKSTEEWKIAVNEYLVDVEDQLKEWASVNKQANKDVGNALDDSKQATQDLTKENTILKNVIIDKVIPALGKELEAVNKVTEAYSNQRKELQLLIDKYETYLDAIDSTISSESEKSIESDESIVSGLDLNVDYSELIMNYLKNNSGAMIYDEEYMRLRALREAKIDQLQKNGVQVNLGSLGRGSDFDKEMEKMFKDKIPASHFDTGGYTGEWGPEGKIAVLHQKELVLNESDTSNLLSTISFVRELISTINSKALMSSLFNLFSTPGINTNNQGIEQNIEIYADFPNATDRNEIAEAFNNLLNTASQYANRRSNKI